MFFHKSINCTRHSQSADFIYGVTNSCQTCFPYLCAKLASSYLSFLFCVGNLQSGHRAGVEHIMHIIIENGSSYKNACRMLTGKYHIVWQPYVTHIINLMLNPWMGDIANNNRKLDHIHVSYRSCNLIHC
jgi:hypothetical protein